MRTRSGGLYAPRSTTIKEFFWRYLNAGIKPAATCIPEHSGQLDDIYPVCPDFRTFFVAPDADFQNGISIAASGNVGPVPPQMVSLPVMDCISTVLNSVSIVNLLSDDRQCNFQASQIVFHYGARKR